MRRTHAERAVFRAYLLFLLRRSLLIAAIVVPVTVAMYYAIWWIQSDEQDAVELVQAKVGNGQVVSYEYRRGSSTMIVQLDDGRIATFNPNTMPGLYRVGEKVSVSYREGGDKRIYIYRIEQVKQSDPAF